MENSIDQLNKVLFETLEQAKNKTVDAAHVKNITNISSQILNSAKLQFDFHQYNDGLTKMKIMPGKGQLEIDSKSVIPEKDLTDYEKKCIVAEKLNYNSVGRAISDLTKEVFDQKVKEHFSI
jgi:hypothetical protein